MASVTRAFKLSTSLKILKWDFTDPVCLPTRKEGPRGYVVFMSRIDRKKNAITVFVRVTTWILNAPDY
jgi:hypothetical protein